MRTGIHILQYFDGCSKIPKKTNTFYFIFLYFLQKNFYIFAITKHFNWSLTETLILFLINYCLLFGDIPQWKTIHESYFFISLWFLLFFLFCFCFFHLNFFFEFEYFFLFKQLFFCLLLRLLLLHFFNKILGIFLAFYFLLCKPLFKFFFHFFNDQIFFRSTVQNIEWSIKRLRMVFTLIF